MRFGALIPVLAFALAACGRDAPPAPPLGTFVLDAEAMSRALVAQGTPEKAARRQAAAGRARLVFDPAGTFTLVVRDEGGRVELINEAARQLLGADLETRFENLEPDRRDRETPPRLHR